MTLKRIFWQWRKPKIIIPKFNCQSKYSYISDVHVDTKNKVPGIKPVTDFLIVVGDVGNPSHPHVRDFFSKVSDTHKMVFFVPGNHDYDCSALYDSEKENMYKHMLKNLCEQYKIKMLDNEHYFMPDNHLIIGSTLWCGPKIPMKMYAEMDYNLSLCDHFFAHRQKFNESVEYIEKTVNENQDKIIIVATHFVPTFELIEDKYKKTGIESISWYASPLDHMIKNPIKYWIAGHTHSKISTMINNVYCGVNAHDAQIEQSDDRLIEPMALPWIDRIK